MIGRFISVALVICGGLIAGLLPSGPERALDVRAADERGQCYQVTHADFIAVAPASDLPDPLTAVPNPKPGSTLKVISIRGAYAKVVEDDRSGRIVASYDLGSSGSRWMLQTSQIEVPCSRLIVRPECKSWPQLMWSFANRKAANVRAKRGDSSKISQSGSPQSPHYWAAKSNQAAGFRDERGVWHQSLRTATPGS